MTWTYFALVDESRIKIGKADDVVARLQQHARGTLDTHNITLLAAVEGVPADERHIQRYFNADAIEELRPANGGTCEVFHPSPAVTNYIRWLRGQWFTVVDAEDTIDERVTYSEWCPTPDRQTPPPSDPLFPADYTEFPPRLVTSDDYYTNPLVLECVRKAIGTIDLDPASHALANRHVKASKYYSINDNGLDQRWGGRVWLNPPFSQWQLWVPKILSEWRSGRIESLCVLSAMRTVTAKYFRRLLDSSSAMCIITGRIPFGGIGGESPDDGHCVLYFGNNVTEFVDAFSTIGCMWKKP